MLKMNRETCVPHQHSVPDSPCSQMSKLQETWEKQTNCSEASLFEIIGEKCSCLHEIYAIINAVCQLVY